MDISALNSTQSLRQSVLIWMSLCFGCISLIFALLNIFVNNFVSLGFLELIYSFYCLYNIYHSKNNSLQLWQTYTMCMLATVIIVAGNYLSSPQYGIFIWSFTLPVLYYLLLGKRLGIIFSSLLLFLQGGLLVTKVFSLSYLTLNLSLNLFFAYCSIWAISHIFEGSREHASNRLKSLALLDPLTGVGNRLSLNHYFEVELQNKTNVYLFILDLDYFKQINDKYGHDVGDKVLSELATILRRAPTKGYVFRVGGEEFAIISSFDSFTEAVECAQDLRMKIQNTAFTIEQKCIHLTISVGIAKYQKGQSLQAFCKAADKQLYNAKHAGRNKVCVNTVEKSKVELVPA